MKDLGAEDIKSSSSSKDKDKKDDSDEEGHLQPIHLMIQCLKIHVVTKIKVVMMVVEKHQGN